MNKSQLIEELSKRVGNDKEEIRYILEELNNIILESRRKGMYTGFRCLYSPLADKQVG